MRFVISARGEAREQYIVKAESEEDARAMFERGDLPKPAISEVHDAEIVSVDAIGSGLTTSQISADLQRYGHIASWREQS